MTQPRPVPAIQSGDPGYPTLEDFEASRRAFMGRLASGAALLGLGTLVGCFKPAEGSIQRENGSAGSSGRPAAPGNQTPTQEGPASPPTQPSGPAQPPEPVCEPELRLPGEAKAPEPAQLEVPKLPEPEIRLRGRVAMPRPSPQVKPPVPRQRLKGR